MSETRSLSRPGFGIRTLNVIENVGNRLPHPVWLFVILSIILALASALLNLAGVVAVKPDGDEAPINNLASMEGIRFAFSSVIDNFMTFPPLGVALVALLGLAVADRSGLITAFMRQSLARVSPRFLTPVVAFTGSLAHVAGDAGYIILIPLAGIIYRSMGRSPITGALVALVSLSGGASASPILIPNDAIFSGLTTAAAQTVDPDYVMTPVGNIYFTVVSSLFLTLVITVVVDGFLSKRIEARLPVNTTANEEVRHEPLSTIEIKALRNVGIALVAYVVAIVLAMVPTGSPLRGEDGGIIDSVLIKSVAVFLALFFAIAGTVYGITTKKIRTSSDIPDLAADGLKDITPILVLFFAVSQFLAYFNWTNIGTLIATRGAHFLEGIDAPVPVIFGGMLLIVSVMNFFITSGSAQWSLVGPVFVPMFMLLDISPETTTALYRIADSCTNILTPMSPYFALTIGIMRGYRKDIGIGSLFSLTLPLSIALFVVWTAVFALWYLIGLPLGPGAPVR
ncbi:AbgT family transporter [Brevibacterium marinum]|uniref:Aminobenzoyl-glutamate transport protein n=1 Tax=Brevibacterium marinum TaxID=418643 RepID=A0A846RRY3_9MICO|nr:AbgT family transporter [Brevibacterium marinum]NJC56519.1 aminobenzoyl-glutamate transport protein [Brevibacterium marinum]